MFRLRRFYLQHEYQIRVKNVVNWTNPKKTMPIYIAVVLLWVTAIFIKGRYLLLLTGLSQFFYKYMPNADGTQFSDRFHNMMQSVPNDDDLDSIYAEERKLNVESRLEVQHNRIKEGVLNVLLRCKFSDQVWIKVLSTSSAILNSSSSSSNHSSSSSSLLFKHSNPFSTASTSSVSSSLTSGIVASSGQSPSDNSFIMLSDRTTIPAPSPDWINVFVVLQEKRFVWWNSEADILEGRPPLGQLIFHGVGIGLTQVSPIDVRDMCNEATRLVAIMGCDERSDPLKCTLLCSDESKCQTLQTLINNIA